MYRYQSIGATALVLMTLATPACAEGAPGADAQNPAEPGSAVQSAPLSASALPEELAAWEAARQRECVDDLVGQFEGIDRAFLTADFNADGRPDYVLSESNVRCDDGTPEYARYGRAGPDNQFLISGARGYTLLPGFSSTLAESQIARRETGDLIQLAFEGTSGTACAGAFTVTWGWTGSAIAIVDRRDAKGRSVTRDGCAARTVPGLPISLGYYGHFDRTGANCEQQDGIEITSEDVLDIDGAYPLLPVRKLDDRHYRLGTSYTVEIIDADRFAMWVTDAPRAETERQFEWCAREGQS